MLIQLNSNGRRHLRYLARQTKGYNRFTKEILLCLFRDLPPFDDVVNAVSQHQHQQQQQQKQQHGPQKVTLDEEYDDLDYSLNRRILLFCTLGFIFLFVFMTVSGLFMIKGTTEA